MNCPLENRENVQLLLDYCVGKEGAEGAAQGAVQDAATLERHLEICASCQKFVREQGAVWAALDSWEAGPVSPDFNSGVYRRIERDASWWDLLLRPFRPALFRRGVPVAAAACLLLGAGALLQRPVISPVSPYISTQMSTQPDVVQDVAQVEPEQVEHALDAMETLSEFSRHVRAENPESKLKL
jgi:hypothetical protein